MLINLKTKQTILSVSTYFFLLFALFFIWTFSMSMGTSMGKSNREKIHVKNDHFFVETFIEISQKKIKVNSNLIYYWYKSRSINSTKGGYSGHLLDGNFDKFSLNKKLIEQGTFKRGLKHGIWKSWYQNGELKSRCNYKKGLKHGQEILYNQEGIVTGEHKYNRGNQEY